MKKYFPLLLILISIQINAFSQSNLKIRDSSYVEDYIIICDSTELNKIISKHEVSISSNLDFNNVFLIFHRIWIDCSGTFEIKSSYDSISNTYTCKLYEYYGGSRGMCIKNNFITLKKTKPGFKIIFKEYRLDWH